MRADTFASSSFQDAASSACSAPRATIGSISANQRSRNSPPRNRAASNSDVNFLPSESVSLRVARSTCRRTPKTSTSTCPLIPGRTSCSSSPMRPASRSRASRRSDCDFLIRVSLPGAVSRSSKAIRQLCTRLRPTSRGMFGSGIARSGLTKQFEFTPKPGETERTIVLEPPAVVTGRWFLRMAQRFRAFPLSAMACYRADPGPRANERPRDGRFSIRIAGGASLLLRSAMDTTRGRASRSRQGNSSISATSLSKSQSDRSDGPQGPSRSRKADEAARRGQSDNWPPSQPRRSPSATATL